MKKHKARHFCKICNEKVKWSSDVDGTIFLLDIETMTNHKCNELAKMSPIERMVALSKGPQKTKTTPSLEERVVQLEQKVKELLRTLSQMDKS